MLRAILIVLCGIWFTVTMCGFWKALEYERSAAHVATPPDEWPVVGAPTRDPARPTLLLFVHPKCPCTRATLRELDRLLARQPGQLTVYAIFLRPETVSPGWEQTELWTYACEIPGVRAIADERDKWRKMFQMSSSGECLLYGRNGKLRFHGGITAGRGHEGYSESQTLLNAAISPESAPLRRTAVFGCGLECAKQSDQVIP